MNQLKEMLAANEDWLMERILEYAKRQGYAQYTSTLVEAWRLSISGISKAIMHAIDIFGSQIPEFSPKDDYTQNPIAQFGVAEARLHRQRGISLSMFLGLLKYYRQSYKDLVQEQGGELGDQALCESFIVRCFDIFELALCVEWSGLGSDHIVSELQTTNRQITNEKNRYVTLFESLPDPAIFLDRHSAILNMNVAAARLLEAGDIPGGIYYEGHSQTVDTGIESIEGQTSAGITGLPVGEVFTWLESTVLKAKHNKDYGTDIEIAAEIKGRLRWFRANLSSMLDISGKFQGMVVILKDVTEQRSTQQSLEISEERLAMALDATSDGIWDWNVKTGKAFFSARYYTMLGFEPHEFKPSYEAWRSLIHPDDIDEVEAILKAHLSMAKSFAVNFRMRTKTGEWRWILGRGQVAERDANGQAVRMVGTHMDITEKRLAEKALENSNRRLTLAKQSGGIGVWELDLSDNSLIWDTQMFVLYQVIPGEFEGVYQAWRNRVHPDDIQEAEKALDTAIETGGHFSWEFRILLPNNEVRNIRAAAMTQFDDTGKPIRMTGVNWDITDRKRMEEELRVLATKDSLTGVNNRRNFLKLAREELGRCRRYSHSMAFLMFDLDHFKSINDTYGHNMGDLALQVFSKVCSETLRESDIFGRLGGEEFGACLVQTGEREAIMVAERLRKKVSQISVSEGEATFNIQVSIGVSFTQDGEAKIQDILNSADTALYEAKQLGRNRVVAATALVHSSRVSTTNQPASIT